METGRLLKMGRYAAGVDYGSLSGRAVLVDLDTGKELAASVFAYPHGVMMRELPDGTPLPDDWAVQDPQDYLEVLRRTIPQVLRESGVSPEDVIAVGVDCTANTALPVRTDGKPLCFLPEFASHPHAWMKMWKHHAAQPLADRMTELAEDRGEGWLPFYGGRVSSEWSLPKLWQIVREDEEVCRSADRWVEAADWLVWQLCGKLTPNACAAGYKAFWRKGGGLSSRFSRSPRPPPGTRGAGKARRRSAAARLTGRICDKARRRSHRAGSRHGGGGGRSGRTRLRARRRD